MNESPFGWNWWSLAQAIAWVSVRTPDAVSSIPRPLDGRPAHDSIYLMQAIDEAQSISDSQALRLILDRFGSGCLRMIGNNSLNQAYDIEQIDFNSMRLGYDRNMDCCLYRTKPPFELEWSNVLLSSQELLQAFPAQDRQAIHKEPSVDASSIPYPGLEAAIDEIVMKVGDVGQAAIWKEHDARWPGCQKYKTVRDEVRRRNPRRRAGRPKNSPG